LSHPPAAAGGGGMGEVGKVGLTMEVGTVYLVGAGPGDPGLITWKGLEVLRRADVVVYDRLVSPALLALARPDAEQIHVGKVPGGRGVRQEEINVLLVEKARAGRTVCRLKGGDPFVFGRGGEEALHLVEAGVPFVVVPGVTSAVAVPAYAGIPVTHRGMARSFAVATGHRCEAEEGGTDEGTCPAEVPRADVLVYLMGVENLPRIVAQLRRCGWEATAPAAVIQQGTTPAQRTAVGTLADIVERAAGVEPPAVLVVGETVALRDALNWFERLPLFGKRVLVTRAREQAGHLAVELALRGAEPVVLPTIAVQPLESPEALDAALCRLREFRWILFTSANAVRAVWERMRALGLDARAFAGVRLGAIGTATAAALLEVGLQADFVPQRHTSAAIVEEIGDVRGARILLPRSDIAPPDLAEGLRARGAQVEAVVAYRTVPAGPPREVVERVLEEGVDIATFTSSSTVANLAALVAPRSLEEVLRGALVACIGPVTAQAARERGLHVDLIAPVHTEEGLVDALVAHFRGG
ncbi:MAG: uroporphyrinogen-III C-methyltransferase, partial [Anaerolineae bacterium]